VLLALEHAGQPLAQRVVGVHLEVVEEAQLAILVILQPPEQVVAVPVVLCGRALGVLALRQLQDRVEARAEAGRRLGELVVAGRRFGVECLA